MLKFDYMAALEFIGGQDRKTQEMLSDLLGKIPATGDIEEFRIELSKQLQLLHHKTIARKFTDEVHYWELLYKRWAVAMTPIGTLLALYSIFNSSAYASIPIIIILVVHNSILTMGLDGYDLGSHGLHKSTKLKTFMVLTAINTFFIVINLTIKMDALVFFVLGPIATLALTFLTVEIPIWWRGYALAEKPMLDKKRWERYLKQVGEMFSEAGYPELMVDIDSNLG